MFQIWIVPTAVQLHKFTKHHCTVHVQWADFMVCKLSLNRAVKNNLSFLYHTTYFKINKYFYFYCKAFPLSAHHHDRQERV